MFSTMCIQKFFVIVLLARLDESWPFVPLPALATERPGLQLINLWGVSGKKFFASSDANDGDLSPDLSILGDGIAYDSLYSETEVSDFTVIGENSSSDYDVWKHPSPKRTKPNQAASTSWMDKNRAFSNQVGSTPKTPQNELRKRETISLNGQNEGVLSEVNKTFRQDFRGTRVFVKNIPSNASWQDLKDHFRVAGEVVFASISVDRETGQPKGHGVVQFETTEGARNAIRIMREHPMDGSQLYVRPDVQENEGAALRNVMPGGKRGPTPPSKWKCAFEEALEQMSQEDYKAIRSLIKARDEARRRRNYDASDDMRDELKYKYGVHIDDRLKIWWVSYDGKKVPQEVSEAKGEGRWGNMQPWRQIPTTEENDACVNPDLVNGLLRQRDIARREKDFATADALLEEARACPDGDLNLRIHDESRTWRVWTDEPPPKELMQPRNRNSESRYESDSEAQGRNQKNPRDECMALVREHAPEKEQEISRMLEQFPGREASILEKLRERYG